MTPKTLTQNFGSPDKAPVERKDGQNPRPLAPSYTIDALDFVTKPQLITLDPVLIDFGESGSSGHGLIGQTSNRKFGIPPPWAAPEVLIDKSFSKASDIWSLGCLIYQARAGQEIFGLDTAANTFYEMVVVLGPPPFSRWYHAEFDRFGHDVVSTTPSKVQKSFIEFLKPHQYIPLKDRVFNIRDRPSGMQSNNIFWGTGQCCVADDEHTYPKISTQEASLLYDLLSRIFQWDPAKRINAADIVGHPWFRYESDTM